MFQLCSLASGSSGNCIYVGNDNTHILIDAGISGKRIKEGLTSINIDPDNLDGILVTHEHSDHIKGLGVMARRHRIPIYLTSQTWSELKDNKTVGKIDEALIRFIKPDKAFYVNKMEIMPFKTFHDATDSVCYTFNSDNKKIGMVTDSGKFDEYMINHLRDSNLLYVEANHDVKMLESGSYPYYLKRRILSDLGHLSNEHSTRLISEIIHKELSHVVLAHLSKENNHPDIAYLEAKHLLDQVKKEKNYDIQLVVAKRDTHSEAIVIK